MMQDRPTVERRLTERSEPSLLRSGEIVATLCKPKKGYRQRIPLPPEVMDVLRWHVETQLTHPAQIASDLLFPSVMGGFKSNGVFRKPFESVLAASAIGRRPTAKGMRRTFNDITRLAGVRDAVIRAVSGHATATMQERCSTVAQDERRQAVAAVIDLATRRPAKPEPVSRRGTRLSRLLVGAVTRRRARRDRHSCLCELSGAAKLICFSRHPLTKYLDSL